MQEDILFSSLTKEILSASRVIGAHVSWLVPGSWPSCLASGVFWDNSGAAFQRHSVVFSLSPLLVKMLGYFWLHALNVAWCISVALLASGKRTLMASVFSCCELHKETSLDSPGLQPTRLTLHYQPALQDCRLGWRSEAERRLERRAVLSSRALSVANMGEPM